MNKSIFGFLRFLMKHLRIFLMLAFLTFGCGQPKTLSPGMGTVISPTLMDTLPSTVTTTTTSTSTRKVIANPSVTPTITSTATQTPYPIPVGIMSNDELQQKMDAWVSEGIIITDADRELDEVDGHPLRLGVLIKPDHIVPPLNWAQLIFYNLGFTIIENSQGIPYILNMVGFEDGQGERFTFPLHIGRLLKINKTIILGEYYGKRINWGKIIFQDKFTPRQFVQKSTEIIDYINIGSTTVGTNGEGNEEDDFITAATKTTNDLIQFLDCEKCSLQNIPVSLERYINQIPIRFEPTIPYFWRYTVSYKN